MPSSRRTLLFQRLEHRRIVLQELLDVLAALTEAVTAEREPGSALLDDLAVDGQIEQIAFASRCPRRT